LTDDANAKALTTRIWIEGKAHVTVDWTCGGFALHGYHGPLALDESVEGTITGGIVPRPAVVSYR